MINSLIAVLITNTLQLFIFALVLFYNKRYAIKANKVLAVLLIISALSLLIGGVMRIINLTSFYLIGFILSLLIAPVFYYYVRTYLTNEYVFKKSQLIHLLPFIAQLIIWLLMYLALIPNEQNGAYDRLQESSKYYFIQLQVTAVVQALIYIYLIGRSITLYHKNAKKEYSYTNGKVLKWFYLFIGTIAILPFIVYYMKISEAYQSSMFLPIVLSTFTFVMILMILTRPEIYQGVGMVISPQLKNKFILANYKDRLSLYNRLISYMEKDEIFLNPKLKIRDLSDALETNHSYLSQAINSLANKTFFDFINLYRIDYAKKMLTGKQYSTYTIEAIARESGFNSRSAFYNAFKKFNSISPKQFIEKHSN